MFKLSGSLLHAAALTATCWLPGQACKAAYADTDTDAEADAYSFRVWSRDSASRLRDNLSVQLRSLNIRAVILRPLSLLSPFGLDFGNIA